MPDKTKSPRPKLKVEEISEETEETAEETVKEDTTKQIETKKPEEKVNEEEKDETPSDTLTPKITSFSQLDTQKKGDQISSEEEPPKEIPEKVEAVEEEVFKEKESTEKKEKEDVSSSEIKEWLKEVRPDTSKEVEKKGGPNTKLIVFTLIILLILGAVVGGVFYFRQSVTKEPSGETPEKEETSTPTPTQEPETEVDISTLTLSVLNGSGTAGVAGKAKDLLTEAGFMEDKISTGNAQSYDYTATSVSLKKDLSEKVFDEIKSALSDTYDVVKSDTTLEEDSTYDVIIIVGKEK